MDSPSYQSRRPTVVVSGLPRAGTSMAMQMLHAGGLDALTDHERAADTDNPRGYFELERVKSLRTDKTWLDEAEGRVVKIIHLLLLELPTDRPYKVIFMERDLGEVVASQAKMLERLGRSGAALAPTRLRAIYEAQLKQVHAHLEAQACFEVLRVPYAEAVALPATQAERMHSFVGGALSLSAMVAAVDPQLHRNRA